METVISVEHLSHSYGDHPALRDLSFDVRQGEVLGLLGPNGAGKTTTIRLLNGLFPPSAGRMQVLGLDPIHQGDQVRRQTGVLTETPALYERLTALQNLDFFAAMAGMEPAERRPRIHELLALFELEPRAGDRVETYSKGMKQRLALARALLTQPLLLFLDEPTSGLDPETAQQVHELIGRTQRRNGRSVVLCTHNLFEAERLCDRLAILNHGRLLALGSLPELRPLVSPGLWVDVQLWQPFAGAASALEGLPGILQVAKAQADGFHLQVQQEAVIPQVAARLVAAGAQILALQPHQVTLEEIYFKLQHQDEEEVTP